MISRDLAALAALLDDELIYIHSSGQADSKEEYLEALRQNRFSYEDISVISDQPWQGNGYFILVQFISATMKFEARAEPLERSLATMSVWRKHPTGWRLLAMQSTSRA